MFVDFLDSRGVGGCRSGPRRLPVKTDDSRRGNRVQIKIIFLIIEFSLRIIILCDRKCQKCAYSSKLKRILLRVPIVLTIATYCIIPFITEFFNLDYVTRKNPMN